MQGEFNAVTKIKLADFEVPDWHNRTCNSKDDIVSGWTSDYYKFESKQGHISPFFLLILISYTWSHHNIY